MCFPSEWYYTLLKTCSQRGMILLESWSVKLAKLLSPKRGNQELLRISGVCSLLQALQKDTLLTLCVMSIHDFIHFLKAEPYLVKGFRVGFFLLSCYMVIETEGNRAKGVYKI